MVKAWTRCGPYQRMRGEGGLVEGGRHGGPGQGPASQERRQAGRGGNCGQGRGSGYRSDRHDHPGSAIIEGPADGDAGEGGHDQAGGEGPGDVSG